MPATMQTPVNVICMKWGTLYGPEYVNFLRAGVGRHLKRPFRFVCFTDDAQGLRDDVQVFPLPELGLPKGERDLRWRKLAVFRRELQNLQGATLFLDLDQVVVGALDDFFALPGRFLIIRDDDLFRAKPLRKLNAARDRFLHSVGNSSVFRFEIGAHADILDAYLADPAAATAAYENEQEFLSGQLAAQGELAYWPKGWCVSFKNDCVPRGPRSYLADPTVPDGARIVVFAGTPKMSDVLAGGGHKWYRRIGDVRWLREAWAD
jgi:hypothetical protein